MKRADERVKWFVLGFIIGAFVLTILFILAPGAGAQTTTLAGGFCGFPSVSYPTGGVQNAAALHASQSVLSTVASAAPTIPSVYSSSIVGALVYVEQAAIRARTDGPTVAGTFDGNPYAVNSVIQVCGSDLARWSAIASSAGANAVLRWNFYTSGR